MSVDSPALAKAMMEQLAQAGAELMLAVPGGGPNLEKIQAGKNLGLRFALMHGETSACIMAGVYGLLTGTPGVVMVTRGPGLASAVNGLACATLDRLPLVLISDRVPHAASGRVGHQRFDQLAVTQAVTKWSGAIGGENPSAVGDAAQLTLEAPAGAVHLDFDPTFVGHSRPVLPSPVSPDPQATAAARDLVAGSRKPVFLVGAEAIPWAGQVRILVEGLGAPALVSYQAKGVIPDHSPSYGGLFTNSSVEQPLVGEADLIVVMGLDPVEPLPRPWPYQAPVAVFHPWPLTAPYFPAAVEVNGPIDQCLAGLAGAWTSSWSPRAGPDANDLTLSRLRTDQPGFTPFSLLDAVLEAGPPDPIVTVDAGAHFLVVMPYTPVSRPLDLLISNGLATMGFSLPAAMGAALARPNRPVVCMVGDGGLGMTLAELETLARLDLGVTVVVFNDSTLSLIDLKQAHSQGAGPSPVHYGPIDFAQAARALGIPGHVAHTGAEAKKAMSSGTGPRLVDARIDPGAYVHVIKTARG